ncbi:MAG TPA: NADH-quinone oxidoreductase subunit C [Solirubrobacteraceae bacterium]|nr:NADH-quinone oxidoreductase subunit C [Solirubrobacteraceae bacterium]
MPDATGLELIAQELREGDADAVLETLHFRDRATLIVEPAKIAWVLERLRDKGFSFLASVHGVDYYPEEPRLGVLYELLDMENVDRLTVKLRVHIEAAEVPSVTPDWPTADHQEREIYDMFGVVFTGHPDLRRILMPEDYEGFPQRRDFPVGGEPVLFTYNDARGTDYTQ